MRDWRPMARSGPPTFFIGHERKVGIGSEHPPRFGVMVYFPADGNILAIILSDDTSGIP